MMELPTKSGPPYVVHQLGIELFHSLYPLVDVEAEIKLMSGWLLGNPRRRPGSRGMDRFIHGWLKKESRKAHKELAGQVEKYLKVFSEFQDLNVGRNWESQEEWLEGLKEKCRFSGVHWSLDLHRKAGF